MQQTDKVALIYESQPTIPSNCSIKDVERSYF